MRTVVVTGATGFLGREVIGRLRGQGLSVIAASRRPGDGLHQVSDYTECPVADVIVHLAEEPNRAKVNQCGEHYLNRSAMVTSVLCSLGARLVYASSGVVYGDSGSGPYGIDAAVEATDVYSASKLRNEQIVCEAGGVILRLANLYGTYMSPDNVLSDIAKQIPGNGLLKVRDDAPVRDFLHVDDAATAIAASVGSAYRGVLNVGSGAGFSIRAIAQLALETAGEEGREIVATASSGRRSFSVLDISITQRQLGWSPALAPQDSLRRFFRNGAKP